MYQKIMVLVKTFISILKFSCQFKHLFPAQAFIHTDTFISSQGVNSSCPLESKCLIQANSQQYYLNKAETSKSSQNKTWTSSSNNELYHVMLKNSLKLNDKQTHL